MNNPKFVGYLPGAALPAAGSPYGGTATPDVEKAYELGELLPAAPNNSLPGVKKSIAIDLHFTDFAAVANVLIGPTFPKFSRTIRSYYEVLTTFTSASDAATIGFGFATDDAAGIVATTAISTGTTWDATGACVEGIQSGAITAAGERLTADRQLQVIRGGAEVLTAGHLVLYIDYLESVAA